MEKKSKKEWLADYAAGRCYTREESSKGMGNHVSPQEVWGVARDFLRRDLDFASIRQKDGSWLRLLSKAGDKKLADHIIGGLITKRKEAQRNSLDHRQPYSDDGLGKTEAQRNYGRI